MQSNTHVWHRGISAWLCFFAAWGREREQKHSLYVSSWMCRSAVVCYVNRAWSHLCLFARSMMREMAVQSLWWWSAQQIHARSHCAENQWQKCFEVCCGNMLEQNMQSDFSETDATLCCVINTFLLLLHWNITGDVCLRLVTATVNKNSLRPQDSTITTVTITLSFTINT